MECTKVIVGVRITFRPYLINVFILCVFSIIYAEKDRSFSGVNIFAGVITL